MRYLKPQEFILINNEVCKLKFSLDVIDELQDKTEMPLPKLMTLLTNKNKKTKKAAVEVLLKYLLGKEVIVEDDKLEYYGIMLLNTYINQIKAKPIDGEVKEHSGEDEKGFEYINIEELFYIATMVLNKSESRAWEMTVGEIHTLLKEHFKYKGYYKKEKEVNIDDVI